MVRAPPRQLLPGLAPLPAFPAASPQPFCPCLCVNMCAFVPTRAFHSKKRKIRCVRTTSEKCERCAKRGFDCVLAVSTKRPRPRVATLSDVAATSVSIKASSESPPEMSVAEPLIEEPLWQSPSSVFETHAAQLAADEREQRRQHVESPASSAAPSADSFLQPPPHLEPPVFGEWPPASTLLPQRPPPLPLHLVPTVNQIQIAIPLNSFAPPAPATQPGAPSVAYNVPPPAPQPTYCATSLPALTVRAPAPIPLSLSCVHKHAQPLVDGSLYPFQTFPVRLRRCRCPPTRARTMQL